MSRAHLSSLIALAIASSGCSLIFDGSEYEGGGMDAGEEAGLDSGVDAGVVMHECDSHIECIDRAEAESTFNVNCIDRGDGRHCISSCNEDAECAGHPFGELCLSGFCEECETSAECPLPGRPLQVHCDTDFGVCSECLTDTHCPILRPHCDFEFGSCSECLTDMHCPMLRPVCNIDSGFCR